MQQHQHQQQQHQHHQQQGVPQPFGLIIPGQAVRTDFEPVDASASKFTMALHFPSPSPSSTNFTTATDATAAAAGGGGGVGGGVKSPTAIADIVFFLLPNITLPANTGATLYWSATSHNPNPSPLHHPSSQHVTMNGMDHTPFSNYHANHHIHPNHSNSNSNFNPHQNQHHQQHHQQQQQQHTSEFELLGALTPDKTSAVFRTGWGTHERLLSLISNAINATNSSNTTTMNTTTSTSTSTITSTPNGGITITLGISLESLDAISNLSLNKGGVSDRTNVAKKIAMDLFNYLQSFDSSSSTTDASTSTNANGTSGTVKSGWMMVPMNVFERWFTRFENKISRDPNFFMKHEI